MLRFDGTRVVLAVRSPSGHEIIPFGPGAEPQFSPDGKWLAAVQQDGAGILVRSFPRPGPHIQISTEGGAQPRWSRDGTRIFYIARDRKMMAVGFDPAKGASSAPHALFQTRIIAQALIGFQYDVAPDGRFLIKFAATQFLSAHAADGVDHTLETLTAIRQSLSWVVSTFPPECSLTVHDSANYSNLGVAIKPL